MYLGKKNNICCTSASDAMNESVLITGLSGSGKSTRMQEMELYSAKQEHTAIVIDASYSHTAEQLFSGIKDTYEEYTVRIRSQEDGLTIPLLEPQSCTDARQEYSRISQAANTLAVAYHLGPAQTGILRNALTTAYMDIANYPDTLSAIKVGLEAQGKDGCAVYSRLWSIFECGVIRKDGAHLQNGKINIIDLNWLDENTQNALTDILLFSLIYESKHSGTDRTYDIFIDECQNFNLSRQSAICTALREGRKFKINMVLATQTLEMCDKGTLATLQQAAYRLYFKPTEKDARAILKELSDGEQQRACKEILRNLKTGSCLATGLFLLNGRSVSRSLILN